MSHLGRRSAFLKVTGAFLLLHSCLFTQSYADPEHPFASPAGCPLNRHNSVAGQYAQACVEAAGQCGVDVLDLWTLMQKDGQVRINTSSCCLLLILRLLAFRCCRNQMRSIT